jgi:hypothetical protein
MSLLQRVCTALHCTAPASREFPRAPYNPPGRGSRQCRPVSRCCLSWSVARSPCCPRHTLPFQLVSFLLAGAASQPSQAPKAQAAEGSSEVRSRQPTKAEARSLPTVREARSLPPGHAEARFGHYGQGTGWQALENAKRTGQKRDAPRGQSAPSVDHSLTFPLTAWSAGLRRGGSSCLHNRV